MARFRQRDTGSVVSVPDEKADAWAQLGDYERLDESSSDTKTASKKTSPRKSSK